MERAIRPSGAHQILEAQHGLITRKQALASGMSAAMVSRRLAKGVWERAGFGVYRITGMPVTWEQRLMAACLAGHAVASHRSAASLWSLAGSAPDVVEITALRHKRTRNPHTVCHESHTLFDQDVTEINGIPVTMPTRTLIDLAVVLTDDELEVVLDDTLRRNLTSVPRIRTMLEVLGPHRRGTARARRVLRRRPSTGAVPESYLETRFVQLLRSEGFSEPARQVRVVSGGRAAYLDFAYEERNLAIELDGYEGHGGRSAWQAGLERMNRIGEIGWKALHFSATDVSGDPSTSLPDSGRPSSETPYDFDASVERAIRPSGTHQMG